MWIEDGRSGIVGTVINCYNYLFSLCVYYYSLFHVNNFGCNKGGPLITEILVPGCS